MSVLIPLVFLVGGFLAVMVMLFRNMKQLDREAGEAWRQVQEMREQRLNAWSNLIASMLDGGACDEAQASHIERKIASCRQADGPSEACEADSSLSHTWQTFAAMADMRRVYTQAATLESIDRLHATDEAALLFEGLFNNAATRYNNAGVTFPALLVAKRAHFARRQLYHPQRVCRTKEALSTATSESLAEASPHIMNAYMLWAVGMSDMTMEEAPISSSTLPRRQGQQESSKRFDKH